MRLISTTLGVILGVAIWSVLVVAALAQMAAEPLVVTFGKPDGERAEIIFSPAKNSPRAITVRTVRVGIAGSRFFLEVDKATTPIINRILADADCKFADGGSLCEFAIAGSEPAYKEIVAAFKKAKTLHVGIESAGAMAMAVDVSLKGFTASYDKL